MDGELADGDTRRVAVRGLMREWRAVTRGVPQWGVVGAARLNISVRAVESLGKFGDDSRLSSGVETLEGRDPCRGSGRGWRGVVHVELMRLKKAKWQPSAAGGWGQWVVSEQAGGEWMESSPEEMDLEVWADKKLRMKEVGTKTFLVRVVRHWARLPPGDVATTFLEVLKARLGGALSNLLQWKVSLPEGGGFGSAWSLKMPSKPKHSLVRGVSDSGISLTLSPPTDPCCLNFSALSV